MKLQSSFLAVLVAWSVCGLSSAVYVLDASENSTSSVVGRLRWSGEDPFPGLGPIEKELILNASVSGSCARVQVWPASGAGARVPEAVIPGASSLCVGANQRSGCSASVVAGNAGGAEGGFWLRVERNCAGGGVVFDLPAGTLVFRQAVVRVGTILPSLAAVPASVQSMVGPRNDTGLSEGPRKAVEAGPYLFGLGERIGPLRLPAGNFTLFTHDNGNPGTDLHYLQNYYGAHPFALALEEGGDARGFFWANAHAMSCEVLYPSSSVATYAPMGVKRYPRGISVSEQWAGQSGVACTAVGGVVDLFVFSGPSPADVVRQYHSLIGPTHNPAPWTLGYHQSRDGYKSVWELETVVRTFNNHSLPLDVIWSDIQYADGLRDFTLDPVEYPEAKMRTFLQWVHGAENRKRYVFIADPTIAAHNASYATWTRLRDSNAFVRDHSGLQPFQGRLWAKGLSWWPDYTHPNASKWWTTELRLFHDKIPFDGVWIDENEVSNLCNQLPQQWGPCPVNTEAKGRGGGGGRGGKRQGIRGEGGGGSGGGEEGGKGGGIGDGEVTPPLPLPPVRDPVLPFVPLSHSNDTLDLSYGSLNISARQWGGTQLELHSLYGWQESGATRDALLALGHKRPFVLSRGTFASSGGNTAHWLGDSRSHWSDLWASLPGTALFGLFGVAHTGADICGFNVQPTAELCTEWLKLGVLFYPFSRNHAGGTVQEPYAFGEPYTSIMRRAMQQRYTLLPHLTTLFAVASHPTSLPANPYISSTLAPTASAIARPLFFANPADPRLWAIDSCAMLGPAILSCPKLATNETFVPAIFPAPASDPISSYFHIEHGTPFPTNALLQLPAPLTYIRTYLQEGHVLPAQPLCSTALSSQAVQEHKCPFQAIVLGRNAQGAFLNYTEDDAPTLLSLNASSPTSDATTLSITPQAIAHPTAPCFASFLFWGQSTPATAAAVNSIPAQFTNDPTNQTVTVTIPACIFANQSITVRIQH